MCQFSLCDERVSVAEFTAAKKAILQKWNGYTQIPNLRQFWMVFFHYVVYLEGATAKMNKAEKTNINTWMNIAAGLK